MADTVTSVQLYPKVTSPLTPASTTIWRFTNVSDGTGESAVKKIDITQLRNARMVGGGNVQPNGLRIETIRWAIQGFAYILIGWDRTAAENTAMILSANGYEDLRFRLGEGGAGAQGLVKISGMIDPSEGNADNKGSILLTTAGNVAGATYDITIAVRLATNLS